jgi:hypothetical protein
MVPALAGQYNPQDMIGGIFKEGAMPNSRALGLNWYASQVMPVHTCGTRTNSTPVGNALTDTKTLTYTAMGSSLTYKIGDVFTIASVYAVNPQTRLSTGSLQQFVVTADLTATTTGTLAISPAIYTATHALATVDSFPVATAVVTMLGSAATSYPQNLVYYKEAITLATADLILPANLQFGSRQNHNGISLRIVQQYDVNNDRLPLRADVLYGFTVQRPEKAVRIWG